MPWSQRSSFVTTWARRKYCNLYDPKDSGLRAILVVDNVAIGPSHRRHPHGARREPGGVLRLARAMTLKNAAAGLPHGGGKSVIFADPRCRRSKRKSWCGHSRGRSRM